MIYCPTGNSRSLNSRPKATDAFHLIEFCGFSTLMFAGVRDILIITVLKDQPLFARLFGDGSDLGLRVTHAAQDQPRGVGDAFIVGAPTLLAQIGLLIILGDDIFYGADLQAELAGKRSNVGRDYLRL